MPGPKPRLHLPFADWPEVDKRMWNSAVANDDPFDDGPGARLAEDDAAQVLDGLAPVPGVLDDHGARHS